MKPEEEAEIILWDWLKDNREIYFNRENKLGWKKFKVEGLQKKPDFIIGYNNGWGKKYIAVEVKSSKNSIDILSSRKIIDYLKNYSNKETKYFIDGREIQIEHFVVATENSPKGFLFWYETLIDNLDGEDGSKIYVTKLKLIPRYEGNRTFEFIRTLWNIYKDTRNELEEKCGLGILIGDIDDNLKPKIMVVSYNKKNKRWGQRWWKI